MSEGKKTERKTLTFKHENPVYSPDIVKSSPIEITFEEYPTRDISKNIYWVFMPIVFNWESELIPGCIRRCVGKTMVKVWVFCESETVPVATTEVPKNFMWL